MSRTIPIAPDDPPFAEFDLSRSCNVVPDLWFDRRLVLTRYAMMRIRPA
jgi:hypothetical protein